MFNIKLNNIIGKDVDKHKWGIDKKSDLDTLLKECKTHLKSCNEEKIKKAFFMCTNAHKYKLRKSGEPFYTHPLNVALILAREIPLDETSVISGLLHEAMDGGNKFDKKDIADEFGHAVAQIVDGIHKIEHIETQQLTPLDQLENYRKLLLSLFQDFRIILVKLADRLHNMRTIEFLSDKGREKLAKETLDVYAPFANRFGLRNIKWELEDLSFKVLNPDAYNEIKAKLNATRQEREEYVKNVIDPIRSKLQNDPFIKKQKIKFDIYGRAKHIYSIYNKMRIRQKNLEELYDLTALRIILDTDDPNMCFYVYGLIASMYQPVPETFKDYINSPKKNGYQSIHTGVVAHKNRPIEVQIRTKIMNEQSEYGVAAHFRYKSGKVDNSSVLENDQISQWISEVREIFENAGNESSEHLLDNVKKNIFMDEIYVFTPKNEFRSLPKDSTPIDFAFSIHSDVGYRYIGAKVNSKMVPVDYKLQSGDQVEIITSNQAEPDPAWINIAISAKAKSAINKYLKDKEKALIEQGRYIWKQSLKQKNITLSENDAELLVNSFKLESREEFYKLIAKNEMNLNKAFDFIKYKIRDGINSPENDNNHKIIKNGKKNGVAKHHKPNITEKNGKFTIELKILGKERENLLADISSTIIETDDITIKGISVNTVNSTFEGIVLLESSSKSLLEKLLKKIKYVQGVDSVESI